MHSLFHPQGVRPYVANWEEVAGFLIDRLYRESIIELETRVFPTPTLAGQLCLEEKR